jgi:hypothetical protein
MANKSRLVIPPKGSEASSREDLLKGVDYFIVSGGGSLTSDFVFAEQVRKHPQLLERSAKRLSRKLARR